MEGLDEGLHALWGSEAPGFPFRPPMSMEVAHHGNRVQVRWSMSCRPFLLFTLSVVCETLGLHRWKLYAFHTWC